MPQLITEKRHCAGCKKPMIAERQWRKGVQPAGHVGHHARGYCRPCYRVSVPPGENRIERERVVQTWAEYAQLETNAQMATRLGIAESAFRVALSRARKAGDERAKTRFQMEEEAILEDWPYIRDDYPVIRLSNGQNDPRSIEAAARRFGVKPGRLESVLAQARERGDDRGRIIYDLRRSA